MRQTMRMSTAIVIFLLVACSNAAKPAEMTYLGQLVPTPRSWFHEPDFRPPAAWLVVDSEFIEASYGPFTTAMHTDPAMELLKENVVPARLPGATGASIIVAEATTSVRVRLRSWATERLPYDHLAGRILPVEDERSGDFTVLSLAPLPDQSEQLLHVTVTFTVEPAPAIGESGEATYMWRLNPAN